MTVEVRAAGGGRGVLTLSAGASLDAVRTVVREAFDSGLHRVEAYVDPTRPDVVRLVARAGLRREGLLRGFVDRSDRLLMARVAGDAEPGTRDGFVAMLNAGLPTKRVIVQGVLRDEHGRVLLCELTYKDQWDLPGGVIERDEAPASGLARELREELGVTLAVGPLVCVNWLPAWRGWDDACLLVFDLGVADRGLTAGMMLQATEIADVHWCDGDAVDARATAATVRLLHRLDEAPGTRGAYFEDAAPPA